MLDGDPAAPTEISQQPHAPNFRPMSIVAKRSPISATAEHLLFLARVKWKSLHSLRRTRMTLSGQHSTAILSMRLWRVIGYMSNIVVLRLTAVFRFIRAVIAVVFAVTEEYGCPHTETRVFTLKLTFSASCTYSQNENTLTNQTPRFVLPTSV